RPRARLQGRDLLPAAGLLREPHVSAERNDSAASGGASAFLEELTSANWVWLNVLPREEVAAEFSFRVLVPRRWLRDQTTPGTTRARIRITAGELRRWSQTGYPLPSFTAAGVRVFVQHFRLTDPQKRDLSVSCA